MAKEILVLVEHRRGEIRDITFEMLTGGRKIAEKVGGKLVAVLLGWNVKEFLGPTKRFYLKL